MPADVNQPRQGTACEQDFPQPLPPVLLIGRLEATPGRLESWLTSVTCWTPVWREGIPALNIAS